MRRSTERIIVSHAGTVPRPANLQVLFAAGESRRSEFVEHLPAAVREVVHHQRQVGIDVVNDGELSKRNFSHYARERLGGLETPATPPPDLRDRNIVARDARAFPGRDATLADIANLKAAVEGLDVEAFLPAVAPGTIEHWLFNRFYPTDEALLFAIAEAMHQEYKLITDAGLNLQIDDPDLPDGWQMFPEMSVADYRKYADVRVEALNHALRDIPEAQIRLHVCWGSGHGPHQNDIPLDDIVDIILKVNAQVYSIEAANPRHDHEWRVWQTARLPEGKSLMPGVVGHATDIVEHPRLVADRLVRYAGIVGKNNIMAGTDCGVGSRVFNAEIAWAKFEALAEGARIASAELWT